jgi:hypothetical protein
MKILSDTLKPVIERWDDPGDYPSNAGQGPLPSYDFVAGIEGEIVLELESGDFIDGFEEVEYDLPHGIKVKKWNVMAKDSKTPVQLMLTVEEFDSEQVEHDDPEPDYDSECRWNDDL